MIDKEKALAQAKKEIEEDAFRAAVEEYKEKLRQQSVWDKLWPWRIVFVRKEQL